jgi:hypothetical protein
MGAGRFSSADWAAYSTTTAKRSTREIFSKSSLDKDLDPMGVTRESRDSDLNPESNAIIVACDVTGSMGMIADNLVRKGLGVLFEEIYTRTPVVDPHIMVMGVGDYNVGDQAPLQVGQFEAAVEPITEQLEKIYVEGGGGGNGYESYDLPMYFAAYHTSIDCFEKRNKRGYMFTIGDEPPPPRTTKESVKALIDENGDGLQADIPFQEVVDAAMKMYNVFHIVIAEGSHCRYHGLDSVVNSWKEYLGQNVIVVDDYTKISEVIVSIIEVNEGADVDTVAKSWDGDTSLVVRKAVSDMEKADAAYKAAKGVVEL